MKEDTCEFPLSEYDWKIVDCSRTLRVTRKKPKVDDRENAPVKVEALKAKYDQLVKESLYRDDNAISRRRLFALLSEIISALEDRANGGKG